MKRISVIGALICFIFLSAYIVNLALAEESQAVAVEQMKSDLQSRGVAANDIKVAESSMNDLVKSGVVPKEAGNIVSRAVRQAHAQGLKGKDLAAKVHGAVKARKDQLKAAKEKAKAAEAKGKEAEKQAKEKAKEKAKKAK